MKRILYLLLIIAAPVFSMEHNDIEEKKDSIENAKPFTHSKFATGAKVFGAIALNYAMNQASFYGIAESILPTTCMPLPFPGPLVIPAILGAKRLGNKAYTEYQKYETYKKHYESTHNSVNNDTHE